MITTHKNDILNEVITITVKPRGIAEATFRRDWLWIQRELNINSSRVFDGVYTLFELRFTDISDLMAGLDWLQDYFNSFHSTLFYEREVYPNVRWTRKRNC